MAKSHTKPQGNPNIPQNYPNHTPKLDSVKLSKIQEQSRSIYPKSKQQIDKEYYQKNKEKKKQQRRERYQQGKEQAELDTQQLQAKYYTAEAIKILMSFKEYTELNKDKMKLWLDFNWTLKDCQENIKEGLGDITAIMKLEQVAGNLVRDYWKTAKSEAQQKSRNWNNLDYDQQQKLIRYWGYEKARVENGYIEELERLERQADSYYKEIEMAKYHEERGKIKCDCWQCEEKAIIHKEAKKKINKELKAIEKENEEEWIKGECNECGEYKKIDSDSGLCRKCDADGEG